MKFKFIGESDKYFKKGNIYELVTMQIEDNYVYSIFVDEDNELINIPYRYIENFNRNWSKM